MMFINFKTFFLKEIYSTFLKNIEFPGNYGNYTTNVGSELRHLLTHNYSFLISTFI